MDSEQVGHVTTKVRKGYPPLRDRASMKVLVQVFREVSEMEFFRLVEYTVQFNHFHFVIEADDRESLARGMKSLLGRIAIRLNRLWGLEGNVFPERYHVRLVKHPCDVRKVLLYVLHDGRKHGIEYERVDPCSSGWWFKGWSEYWGESVPGAPGPRPTAEARSLVLRETWHMTASISIHLRPRPQQRLHETPFLGRQWVV